MAASGKAHVDPDVKAIEQIQAIVDNLVERFRVDIYDELVSKSGLNLEKSSIHFISRESSKDKTKDAQDMIDYANRYASKDQDDDNEIQKKSRKFIRETVDKLAEIAVVANSIRNIFVSYGIVYLQNIVDKNERSVFDRTKSIAEVLTSPRCKPSHASVFVKDAKGALKEISSILETNKAAKTKMKIAVDEKIAAANAEIAAETKRKADEAAIKKAAERDIKKSEEPIVDQKKDQMTEKKQDEKVKKNLTITKENAPILLQKCNNYLAQLEAHKRTVLQSVAKDTKDYKSNTPASKGDQDALMATINSDAKKYAEQTKALTLLNYQTVAINTIINPLRDCQDIKDERVRVRESVVPMFYINACLNAPLSEIIAMDGATKEDKDIKVNALLAKSIDNRWLTSTQIAAAIFSRSISTQIANLVAFTSPALQLMQKDMKENILSVLGEDIQKRKDERDYAAILGIAQLYVELDRKAPEESVPSFLRPGDAPAQGSRTPSLLDGDPSWDESEAVLYEMPRRVSDPPPPIDDNSQMFWNRSPNANAGNPVQNVQPPAAAAAPVPKASASEAHAQNVQPPSAADNRNVAPPGGPQPDDEDESQSKPNTGPKH